MFKKLLIIILILTVAHGYYYLLNSLNGCLGNCLRCDVYNLELCIGDHQQMCMPGYSSSLSNHGQCIPDQNHRDEIKQLEHYQQDPLIRGWSHSEHQICNYYKPNGEIQKFNVLGFFYEHTIQNKQFFIKAYHRSAIITFNIVRNSWDPLSDYLMIKLSTDNKQISENQVSFDFRDYIQQSSDRFKCHGVSFKLQKYQIHVPLGQHNDAKLMVTFESFMNGQATWGITNIHMLIGCSHFITPDSEGQCTQCQVGFYKTYKDNKFYGCQRCPNMCLECSAKNICLACAPGTTLQGSSCVFAEGFHQILIPAMPTSFCGYNSFVRSEGGRVVILDTLVSYHVLLSLSFIIFYDPSQWDYRSNIKLIINQKIVHMFNKDSFQSFSTGQCSQFITNVYEQQKLITPFFQNSHSSINLTIQAFSNDRPLFFGIKSNQIHYMYYHCINNCILCQISTKTCQKCIQGYYLQSNQCILNSIKNNNTNTLITTSKKTQINNIIQKQNTKIIEKRQQQSNQTYIIENNIQTINNHLNAQNINTNTISNKQSNTKKLSEQNIALTHQQEFNSNLKLEGQQSNIIKDEQQNISNQLKNNQNQGIIIQSSDKQTNNNQNQGIIIQSSDKQTNNNQSQGIIIQSSDKQTNNNQSQGIIIQSSDKQTNNNQNQGIIIQSSDKQTNNNQSQGIIIQSSDKQTNNNQSQGIIIQSSDKQTNNKQSKSKTKQFISILDLDNTKRKNLNQQPLQNLQIINQNYIQNTYNKKEQQQVSKHLQKQKFDNITSLLQNNLTSIQQQKLNNKLGNDSININSKNSTNNNNKFQNIGKTINQTITNLTITTNKNLQNSINQNEKADNQTKSQSSQTIFNQSNNNTNKKQTENSQPNIQTNSRTPNKQTQNNQTKQLIKNQINKIQMHLFLDQQTRGIKVRIKQLKKQPKVSKVINKVTNTQQFIQQSKEVKVNQLQIKICLKQSFIDTVIAIYQQDNQQLEQKKSKLIKQFDVKRFDFLNIQAIKQMKYQGSFMRLSCWICLAGMIICLPLGVGIEWEQFSLCLQMLFLYTYLHSQYLPATIKIPLGSLYRMQSLNYFWKELSLWIEQLLLGNVVQYSPLIFTQYHIDINLTRALFPIFLINIYYSAIFGIILAVSHLISNESIILNSRISLWLSKIAHRKINYFNQIWRYQFVAIIWACILQFYNLEYPQNSNRSNQLNNFICFITFFCTICWPFCVYIYSKINQFRSLQIYYYLEGIVYHKMLPNQPLKQVVSLYIYLRYIKYIFFIVTIATLYNYPFPILLLMALIELMEIIYIIKFNIFINSITLKLKVAQNIIFILIDVSMIIIVEITRTSSRPTFFYVGSCTFWLMNLGIINCYIRTVYLLYCRISQILYYPKKNEEVLEPPLTQKNITHQ